MTVTQQELFEKQRQHHDTHYRRRLEEGTVETWLDFDNADSWANTICMEDLRGFLEATPQKTFVTIADGKGGKEARFLTALGHEALPTDLSVDVLAEAKARGLISNFSKQDAQKLSFDDGSFDWALVKESLHHLPLPYSALYEMLRVSREGAILIEPRYTPTRPQWGAKACVGYLAARFLGIWRWAPRLPVSEDPVPPGTYEEAGNYVYQFSAYELMQLGLAAGICHVAYISAHHIYQEGYDKIRGKALENLKQERQRWMKRFDETNGRDAAPLLTFVFFKQAPSETQRRALIDAGFHMPTLHPNPYV